MNSVDEIKQLLLKNKKRLEKELRESREVVILIKKSTHTSLTEDEKEKVKNQLFDIFKAIPAFCSLYASRWSFIVAFVIEVNSRYFTECI